MTNGVGYFGTRDPNVAGVSSSGVSGSGVIAAVSGVNPGDYTASAFTWSPTLKGGNIGLTNGNLTATNTYGANDWDTVKGSGNVTTGKRYYEVILNNMPYEGDFMLGVATNNATNTFYLGSDAYGWSWQFGGSTSAKHTGGVQATYGATGVTTGDVIGVLFDVAAGTLEFTLNGVSQGVAHTGITGVVFYPAASLYYLNPSITARFSPASWSYAPPAGYDSWN